jgi:hypothetical protein
MKKTTKEETTTKQAPKLTIKTIVKLLDRHVLPIIALVVLSALAVKGLSVYLPMMSDNARTIASILAVAVLVVKLKSDS